MEVTEEKLAAAAVAPRVTEAQLNDFISSEVTFTVGNVLKDCPVSDATKLLTMCVLTLKNGFTVTGESACADPANFNQEIGQNLARSNAVKKIWPLLGFELRSKLALIDAAGPATGAIVSLLGSRPLTYVGTKVVRAVPMSRDTFLNLKDGGTRDSSPEEPGYLVEYTDGGAPNVEGFAGYISWSPKDVFENAYTVGAEPRETTWLDRLKQEVLARSGEYEQLAAFIGTPVYDKLDDIDRRYLVKQRDCMEELVWILTKRIQKAEGIRG